MEEKERYEIHIYDDVCVDLYENGVLNKSVNDTYKLENLLNQQDKRIKELENENKQLKQQLNDLPKKIVEEIRDVAGDYWEECGNVPDLNILTTKDFNEILDEILEKYGEEDE